MPPPYPALLTGRCIWTDNTLQHDYNNARTNLTGTLTGSLATGYSGTYNRSDGAGTFATITFSGVENFTIDTDGPSATSTGFDSIVTGDGNDIVRTGAGDDTVNAGGGNDLVSGGTGDDFLNGGAGTDTVSYATAITGVTVRLDDSSAQDTGEGSDTLTGFENIMGSELDDRLIGNRAANGIDGGSGADRIEGGNGRDTLSGGVGNDILNGGRQNDVLDGGAGRDVLTGGTNADSFVFRDGDTGRSTTQADQITDFSHAEGDRIALGKVDANIATSRDDAFTFIGMSAFSGTAGELRYSTSGGDTLVQGDTDGDGRANFTILLTGVVLLVEADFVL